ncbi:MAG: hypothetical protein J7539_05950 [Niabella sp.]|nr:hypothetical protein [Niabella sp.]
MKVPNPTGRTLDELQNNLSAYYPGTRIRKALFNIAGPRQLMVPSDGMKHIVRSTRNNAQLITDFIPPAVMTIVALIVSVIIISLILTLLLGVPVIGGVGGVGFVLIFLLIKALYKSMNKQRFEKFYSDLNTALIGSTQPGSIF